VVSFTPRHLYRRKKMYSLDRGFGRPHNRSIRSRLHLKCDGTRTETIFRLSAKITRPFKSAGALVQSTTGSRGVRISGSNAGYTMFQGTVKCTGYPLHSTVSPSLPHPCVTLCHHISTGVYVFEQESLASVGNIRSMAQHDIAVICCSGSSQCYRILTPYSTQPLITYRKSYRGRNTSGRTAV
jgi:hypothetical protein